MTAQSFQGFGPQALGFFSALAFHQNREWMEENKALYEAQVKQPMGLLLEDLSAELKLRDIPLQGTLKGSMFRLNRDVRFSKNKSPYKTAAAAVLSRGGTKGEQGLLYLHLDPKGSFVACGVYHPLPPQLAEIRRDICERSAMFKAACAAMAPLMLASEDQLTRAPKGFEHVVDREIVAPLRLRSLTFHHALSEDDVTAASLVGKLADFASRAMPFLQFCWNALDRVPFGTREGARRPEQR